MNWKLKARIQNAVALLPSGISYKIYYLLQRKMGALRNPNPISRLKAGAGIAGHIIEQGKTPAGSTFLEVGTGWRINVPLALWLMGAAKIVTVDLNPYMKEELIKGDLKYIRENQAEVEKAFEGLPLNRNRMSELLKFSSRMGNLPDLLELCCIQYIAPGDASALNLADNSIDFHVSCNVFEHIPPGTLRAILIEGLRLIREDGLFIHRIDYSDHFSHSDSSISSINFLQFNDRRWNKIAGNRYMYMNRLRVDDFQTLYEQAGHSILKLQSDMDQVALEAIKEGSLVLDEAFSDKSQDVLATTGSWFITKKKQV